MAGGDGGGDGRQYRIGSLTDTKSKVCIVISLNILIQ